MRRSSFHACAGIPSPARGGKGKKNMFYSRFLGFPGSQLLLVKESLTLPCWSTLRLKCLDPFVCHPEIEGLDRGAWKEHPPLIRSPHLKYWCGEKPRRCLRS
jgi:hypothetical protein